MVNTFLTYFDFHESAKSLDRARLGKQITEAYQILLRIEDYELLSKYFNIPLVDVKKETRLKYCRDIVSRYKSLKFSIVRRDMKIIQNLEKEDDYDGNDRLIRKKFGFGMHPAVIAWIGFSDALREYINAHIDIWLGRGYKSIRVKYVLKEKPERPYWCKSEEYIKCMRAALLNKEITREEKPWYQLKEDFLNAGEFTGYLWG